LEQVLLLFNVAKKKTIVS